MARCVWCGQESPYDGRFCLKCGKEMSGGSIPGKCPKCGVINSFELTKCGNCGAPLPEAKSDMSFQKMPQVPCKWCGKPAPPGQDECWECVQRKADTTLRSLDRAPSETLVLAAVLLAIAGALALFQGLYYAFIGSMFSSIDSQAAGFLSCCGVLDILFGLGAIAGAYFTSKRTNYSLAILGAIVGALGLGLVVGLFLGIAALFIIWGHKNEFG